MWNGPGNSEHQRLSNGAEMCHTSSGILENTEKEKDGKWVEKVRESEQQGSTLSLFSAGQVRWIVQIFIHKYDK